MPHQFPTFEEKRAHEREVAQRVVDLHFPKSSYVRFGNDQGEPDVLFLYNNRLIGIEVTTAYWEDIKSEAATLQEQDEGMCSVIQDRVMHKATRHYQGADMIILCIEARDPAGDEISMLSCILDTPVPPQHPFDRIYVLSYTAAGAEYELFTLYPKAQ